MASRIYTVSGANLTIAGTTTLAFINPPAAPNVSLDILRIWVSQTGSTTSAMQRIQLVTQVTAFPTLTAATPAAHNRADSVSAILGGTAGAAGTAGVNASAEGAGAKTVIFSDGFNVLNGWLWVPTPEEQIVLPPGYAQGLGVYFPAAPASLTAWNVGLSYRES